LLPESYVDQLELIWVWMLRQIETPEAPLKGFKDYEIQRWDRDIEWMRDGKNLPADVVAQRKADFYRFFSEHDRRRDTDFLKTFPEMKAFWEECAYHARNT
jgi:hypothetical protein